MSKQSNHVLIGMPGSGKSTLAKGLAEIIQLEYIDTDDVIRKKALCSLPALISRLGHAGFVEFEEECVCSLACEEALIATGGSVVYSAKAMRHLKKIGTIIYLYSTLECLTARIGCLRDRGVVIRDDQTLRDLHSKRDVLYKAYADSVIDTSALTVEESITVLKECIQGS